MTTTFENQPTHFVPARAINEIFDMANQIADATKPLYEGTIHENGLSVSYNTEVACDEALFRMQVESAVMIQEVWRYRYRRILQLNPTGRRLVALASDAGNHHMRYERHVVGQHVGFSLLHMYMTDQIGERFYGEGLCIDIDAPTATYPTIRSGFIRLGKEGSLRPIRISAPKEEITSVHDSLSRHLRAA